MQEQELDLKRFKGITLYSPEIEVWYDQKKVLVQSINITKDKSPVTYIKISGVITEEKRNEICKTNQI